MRAVKIEHRDKPCYLFDACKKRYILYVYIHSRHKLPRDLLFPFELSLASIILRTTRVIFLVFFREARLSTDPSQSIEKTWHKW